MLAWGYRKQNLLKELLSYKADILCLQEVQSNHFLDFLAPKLQEHGYSAIYKKKTTEIYAGNSYAIDGCATFFLKEKFSLVKKYEVSRCISLWLGSMAHVQQRQRQCAAAVVNLNFRASLATGPAQEYVGHAIRDRPACRSSSTRQHCHCLMLCPLINAKAH